MSNLRVASSLNTTASRNQHFYGLSISNTMKAPQYFPAHIHNANTTVENWRKKHAQHDENHQQEIGIGTTIIRLISRSSLYDFLLECDTVDEAAEQSSWLPETTMKKVIQTATALSFFQSPVADEVHRGRRRRRLSDYLRHDFVAFFSFFEMSDQAVMICMRIRRTAAF